MDVASIGMNFGISAWFRFPQWMMLADLNAGEFVSYAKMEFRHSMWTKIVVIVIIWFTRWCRGSSRTRPSTSSYSRRRRSRSTCRARSSASRTGRWTRSIAPSTRARLRTRRMSSSWGRGGSSRPRDGCWDCRSLRSSRRCAEIPWKNEKEKRQICRSSTRLYEQRFP